ncbi:MAG: hypothetical protein ABIG63_16315 [Chloroflexota bacterium]
MSTLASKMTIQELEQYVLTHSVTGDPDSSLMDWLSGSDLSDETPDDVVTEWDAERGAR